MEIIIDGYNLMHLAGFASARMKPGRFEAARRRFLDWLADSPGARQTDTTLRIIFDAQSVGKLNNNTAPFHRMVQVHYAAGETADDWIERWLQSPPAARQITVVSNDSRIREAARRRGASAWSCEKFLDWLPTGAPIVSVPEAVPEKPEGPQSEEEQAVLLEIFQEQKPRTTRSNPRN